jgi:hypothetical protein
MSTQVCLVPRWSGTRDSDYFPWLLRELRDHDVQARVAPLLPTPDEPKLAATVRSIDDTVTRPALARTVLVAHSVGCQAALRWLAQRPDGERVRAFVAVAGWWEIDAPWPSIKPFLDEPFDVDRARAAAGDTFVYLGDNDPFTSDQQRNAALWRERMGARVTTVPGGAHLNVERFDELRDLVLELAS